MAESVQSLEGLSALKSQGAQGSQAEQPKHVQKIDAQGRAYATGKRKNAVARVWIKPGSGKVVVNTKPIEQFFARPVLRMMIQQPIVAANRTGQYDVICTVSGGGLSGQAGAVRHGISKALTYFEPDLRPPLKRGGFLTRDSRVVERKKYGRAKARRSVPVLEALIALSEVEYLLALDRAKQAQNNRLLASKKGPIGPFFIGVFTENAWTSRKRPTTSGRLLR